MRIRALGHVGIRVTDLARAEAFYSGILGLPIRGHLGAAMTFFGVSQDQFQDLAVIETAGEISGSGAREGVGLDHVAFQVGDTLEDLRAAVSHLKAQDVEVGDPVDHTWSVSVYLRDPDGNGVELYVARSDVWKHDPDFEPTATRLVD